MAEEAQKIEDEQPKKKSPIMTMAIVAVVMVLEALGAVGFIMFSGGGASNANANSIDGEELAEEEMTLEVGLIDGRFQNLASGQAWTWNIEAVLQIKKKNEAKVTEELERRSAEIKEGVALIIRRSAHSHLTEPGLETLHRQIAAYIEQVFGFDPDGESMVERVLIPRCQGAPPA
jgi:flagellar basal body-associated protein FliL